jgi:hypothetical protein
MRHRLRVCFLFIVSLAFPGFACGQTLTTTMYGKWRIDVTASVEASEETKNERALSGAKSLPQTVQCEFLPSGVFTWGQASGRWSVIQEAEDEVEVLFRYPKFERPAKVRIVGRSTLHFHFRPDYPVCVYQRLPGESRRE